jgi:hypothetical protein
MSHNAFSWIEKDNDLAKIIWANKIDFAKPLKITWDVQNYDSKSTKGKKRNRWKPCASTMNKKKWFIARKFTIT